MNKGYRVWRRVSKIRRKIASGEETYYQLVIPKIWAEKAGLDKNPDVIIEFNGILKIIPEEEGRGA